MKSPISSIQQDAIKAVLKGWESNRRQILAWYTGSGKTNVFLGIAKELVKRDPGVKIGIISYLHKNIKKQTSERADLFLKSHYVFKAGDFNYCDENVYIFNPQVLFFRESLPFKFDYLIVDEAHVGINGGEDGYFSKIIANHCKSGFKILGCSATGWELANSKTFKDADLHIRGMDKGLHEDGRLTDFNIHAEQVDLKIGYDAFSRRGDLGAKYIKQNFTALKKFCVSKAKKVVASKSNLLGSKCLIIVPPGNNCDIAKEVARSLGESATYLIGGKSVSGWRYDKSNEDEVIQRFRTDPKLRFLCVVHKCQIGFDMPELTSTIDLTMSRNIGLIIQRWGRLARKQPGLNDSKHYFYVFDSSLSADQAEWIISKSVQYAMCDWDKGVNAKTVRKFPAKVFGLAGAGSDIETTFDQLAALLAGTTQRNHKTVIFSEVTQVARGHWTPTTLIEAARKYKDRTELSAKNRYVYKQMKKHHPAELDLIFPIKNELGKWNWEKISALAKQATGRKQFRNKYSGALHWCRVNGKMDDLDKILPQSRNVREWNWGLVQEKASRFTKLSTFKRAYSGAYEWAGRNGKMNELRMMFRFRHRATGIAA